MLIRDKTNRACLVHVIPARQQRYLSRGPYHRYWGVRCLNRQATRFYTLGPWGELGSAWVVRQHIQTAFYLSTR